MKFVIIFAVVAAALGQGTVDRGFERNVIAEATFVCPGSPSRVRAMCSLNVKFAESCAVVEKEITDRIQGVNGWRCPKSNPGTYRLTSSNGTYPLAALRTTGDGRYTDLFTFTFQSEGQGCLVGGCSESQVFSVIDYSTNYCNMFNLYCGREESCKVVGTSLTFAESYASCRQNNRRQCTR
mmetsp:Transcript_10384/g.11843  ORF Transcript_10384/g.11843 Transcript_10384/m.11843 type:complete len:181 (+) Transcript_10384:27-569(+)